MKVTKEKLLDMYRTMFMIRSFELKAAELFAAGRIPGFVHLYVGEEAVATGVCANLKESDYITSTHRGHGHLLAKGGDVNLMMAEVFGKASGYCKGKGGSMHIADVNLGILGANGIVGAGFPIAVGAAFSCKYRKTGDVVVCFFGDAASNRGTFHEGINFASIHKLPVVFVCENNMYGISNYQKAGMNINDIADRAEGYGIPGASVDGNDVMAVYEAASAAIENARKGDGPSLIECKTWRQRGHFEGDPGKYKDPEEQKNWVAKDPLPRLEKRLEELKYASGNELEAMQKEIVQKVEAAVRFAESGADPEPSELLTDVLA